MNKPLLYISTLIAVFISMSGFFSIKQVSDLIPHLLFLPIPLSLIASSISTTRQKTMTPVSSTVHPMVIASILLFLFTIVGAKFVGIVVLSL